MCGRLPVLVWSVGFFAACNSDTIYEAPPITATVYGVATLNNEPLAGWTVSVLGLSLACERPRFTTNSGVTDADGRYRVVVGGLSAPETMCIRAGLSFENGADTIYALDTIDFRTNPPYDSVRVDFAIHTTP